MNVQKLNFESILPDVYNHVFIMGEGRETGNKETETNKKRGKRIKKGTTEHREINICYLSVTRSYFSNQSQRATSGVIISHIGSHF